MAAHPPLKCGLDRQPPHHVVEGLGHQEVGQDAVAAQQLAPQGHHLAGGWTRWWGWMQSEQSRGGWCEWVARGGRQASRHRPPQGRSSGLQAAGCCTPSASPGGAPRSPGSPGPTAVPPPAQGRPPAAAMQQQPTHLAPARRVPALDQAGLLVAHAPRLVQLAQAPGHEPPAPSAGWAGRGRAGWGMRSVGVGERAGRQRRGRDAAKRQQRRRV